MSESLPASPAVKRPKAIYAKHIEETFFFINQIYIRLFRFNKIGIALFVVFYFNLYAHITTTFLLQHRAVGASFSIADLFTCYVSGTLESITHYAKMLCVYIISCIALSTIAIYIFAFFLPLRFIAYSVRIICRVCYIAISVLLTITINSFIKCYTIADMHNYTISTFIVSVIHILYLLALFWTCFISSRSQLRIIHPLVAKNSKQAVYLYFLFVSALHMSSYVIDDFKLPKIIQLTVYLYYGLYLIVYPVYTYRLQNFVFLTIVYYDFLGLILKLFLPQYRIYGVYLIFLAAFGSFIVYYYIYPVIIYKFSNSSKFDIAYTNGWHKKCLKQLDNFSPKLVKSFRTNQMKSMLLAAVYYNHPKLEAISKCFLVNNMTEWRDRFVMWSVTELINTTEGKLPRIEANLLNEQYEAVKEQEKQLWMCAWLNYYVILPKITAHIGHSKAIYNSIYDLYHDSYPNVTDYDHPKFEPEGLSQKVKTTFYSFDIYIRLLIILFTFLHYLYLKAMYNENDHIVNVLKLQYLSEAVTKYQIAVWNNNLTRDSVNAIMKAYSRIEKDSETYASLGDALNRVYDGISLRSAFNDLIDHMRTGKSDNYTVFHNVFTALNHSLKNYPDFCYADTFSSSKSLIHHASEINACVFGALLLLIVIIFQSFRRSMTIAFDRFYSVPKEVYLKLGKLQPNYDIKYSIPYKPSIWDSLSFLGGFIFFGCFVIILSICTLNALVNRNLVLRDVSNQYEYMRGITSIERIMLLLTQGISESYGKPNYNGSIRNYHDAFYYAGDLYCEVHHHALYQNYVEQLPREMRYFLGRYFLSSTNPINITGFSQVLSDLIDNMDEATNDISAWRKFYLARFIIFVLNIIVTIVLINVCIWMTKQFVTFETCEIRSIVKRVECECEDKQFSKQRIQFKGDRNNLIFDDTDFPMFTVSKSGTLMFQTSAISPLLQIPVGTHIMDSRLPPDFINTILKDITQYQKEFNPKSDEINSSNNQYTIIPHYTFIGQKLELSYVSIASINTYNSEKKEIGKKIDQLVVCSYPQFMKGILNYNPKGRHTIVGIIKIPELDSPTLDLGKLASIHSIITNKICKMMKENVNYCRLREEGSLIITTVNRDSEATPWNMHTLGADFMRKLREYIKTVGEMHGVELNPIVLLFKCHDTLLSISKMNMVMTAFDCPFEYSALERIQQCITTSINYTSEKSETKPQSVTKVRTCSSPRGENFDIFVIV